MVKLDVLKFHLVPLNLRLGLLLVVEPRCSYIKVFL